MTHIHYHEIEGRSLGYYFLLALLGLMIAAGLGSWPRGTRAGVAGIGR